VEVMQMNRSTNCQHDDDDDDDASDTVMVQELDPYTDMPLLGPGSVGSSGKLPSARLTLHSTKFCTKFKIFRIKIYLVLRLPLSHF
jgi:hypothetical protein